MKKLISIIVLICIVIFATGFVSVYDASATIETKITGLNLKQSKSVEFSLSDTVEISPVRTGELHLQIFDELNNKWVDRKTFNIDGKESLKIKYTDDWKNSIATYWRIYIPQETNYKKFVSKKIIVFSRNIETLSLSSKGAAIIRADKLGVLYDKQMDKRLPNASTTKLMTALLALEKGNFKSKVKISKEAAETPYGNLYAVKGDKYYFNDLFNAMLISSSNDSAVALGEKVSKSTKKFVKMMNKKAKKIGCKNTNFKTPHGLHAKNHYSSAYDISLIMAKDLKYQRFVKTISTKTYSFKNVKKDKTYKITTTNELLGKCDGLIGGKTGYTKKAGYCFCGDYDYNGYTYIFTVLGGKSSEKRWKDCKKIIKYIQKYS